MEHIVGNLRGLEKEWWERIHPLLKDREDEFSWYAIQSSRRNRLECPGCTDAFQFGDIRIETPSRTIVIEIEKLGPGLGNLLKYLPLMEGATTQQQDKPLVLIHIWGGSYPTYKALYRRLEPVLFGQFRDRMEVFCVDVGPQAETAVLAKVKALLE